MDIQGLYKVELVGQTGLRQISIVKVIVDTMAHPLYVVDVDDNIYNWQNIIMLVKVR